MTATSGARVRVRNTRDDSGLFRYVLFDGSEGESRRDRKTCRLETASLPVLRREMPGATGRSNKNRSGILLSSNSKFEKYDPELGDGPWWLAKELIDMHYFMVEYVWK